MGKYTKILFILEAVAIEDSSKNLSNGSKKDNVTIPIKQILKAIHRGTAEHGRKIKVHILT